MNSAEAMMTLLSDRVNRRPTRTSYLRARSALRRLFPDDEHTQRAVLVYLEYLRPDNGGLYDRYLDKDGKP